MGFVTACSAPAMLRSYSAAHEGPQKGGIEWRHDPR